MHIVVFFLILQRVGHINLTVNILDTEGRKASRNVRIREAVGVSLLKILIVSLDVAGKEIRDEKKIMAAAGAEGGPFVDRFALRIVHRNDGIGGVDAGIPARDRAIFTREDKPRRLRVAILGHFEERRSVESDSGGVAAVFIFRGW